MRAILTWHSLDPSGSPVSCEPEVFARQVRWIAASGIPVVAVEGILAAPDPALALTFDDAFSNFADEAWPLLRELGLPVTLFVVTGRVGTTNAWGGREDPGIPTLPILGWEALGRLAAEGVRLGGHGRRHCRLAGLPQTEARHEVLGSAEDLLARTGSRPAAFAYPYGSHDAQAAGLAGEAYACAVTTRLAGVDPGDGTHLLPRLDTWYFRTPGALEAFGTARFRARIRTRALLRSLKAAVIESGRNLRGGRS